MAQRLYSRLSIEEREFLFKGLAEGKKQFQIAKELNRDPSAISREIRRAGMDRKSYRPSQAGVTPWKGNYCTLRNSYR